MVPGFDEIIFENRNRKYGAYVLRKKYVLTAFLSALSAIIICGSILLLITAFTPDRDLSKPDPGITVIIKPDNLIDPNRIVAQVPEKPVPVPQKLRYIEPDVVDDTVNTDQGMLTTDFAVSSVVNGDLSDIIDSVILIPVTNVPEEPEPYTFVEEQPIFPGGSSALLRYIAENTIYPQEAIDNNIQGKVFVKFAVWSDGSIRKIEVTRSIHPLLDKEAERVISTLPKWIPGKQNGIPVPVWFSVPVTFQVKFY